MRAALLVLFVALFLLSAVPPFSLAAAVKKGAAGGVGGAALYCALCEVVVDEVNAAIDRTTDEHPGHFVQTKWRIDEKRRIPFARTEHRVMEIIEGEVQPSLHHYGSTNHTGRMRLIRKAGSPPLPTAPLLPPQHDPQEEEEENGSLAADYSPSEFTHSRLLTDTLTSLYERMVDVHLEEMMLLFHRGEDGVKEKLCNQVVKACSKGTTFEPFLPPARQRTTTTSSKTDTDTPSSSSSSSSSPSSSTDSGGSVEPLPTQSQGAGEKEAGMLHSDL